MTFAESGFCNTGVFLSQDFVIYMQVFLESELTDFKLHILLYCFFFIFLLATLQSNARILLFSTVVINGSFKKAFFCSSSF